MVVKQAKLMWLSKFPIPGQEYIAITGDSHLRLQTSPSLDILPGSPPPLSVSFGGSWRCNFMRGHIEHAANSTAAPFMTMSSWVDIANIHYYSWDIQSSASFILVSGARLERSDQREHDCNLADCNQLKTLLYAFLWHKTKTITTINTFVHFRNISGFFFQLKLSKVYSKIHNPL